MSESSHSAFISEFLWHDDKTTLISKGTMLLNLIHIVCCLLCWYLYLKLQKQHVKSSKSKCWWMRLELLKNDVTSPQNIIFWSRRSMWWYRSKLTVTEKEWWYTFNCHYGMPNWPDIITFQPVAQHLLCCEWESQVWLKAEQRHTQQAGKKHCSDQPKSSTFLQVVQVWTHLCFFVLKQPQWSATN